MAAEKRNRKPKAGEKPKSSKREAYASQEQSQSSKVKEPVAAYQTQNTNIMNPLFMAHAVKSRIRAIGNSKGVILNNQLLKDANINTDADVVAFADEGKIIIMQAKNTDINTDISTWDLQFKAAKKKGFKPKGDLFDGLRNDFDSKEW
jgi:antitoxin component of MazEF toxin-antitoxin module